MYSHVISSRKICSPRKKSTLRYESCFRRVSIIIKNGRIQTKGGPSELLVVQQQEAIDIKVNLLDK